MLEEYKRAIENMSRFLRQVTTIQAVTGMPFERAEAMVNAWVKEGQTLCGDTMDHMETQAHAYILRVCRGETDREES